MRISDGSSDVCSSDLPARCQIPRRGRLVVVDGHLAVGIDDAAAALAGDPLQRVAGEAFVGAALPYEALQVAVAGRLLGRDDGAGGLGQVPPGLRHRFAVLFQQIPPVVEQAGIDRSEEHKSELQSLMRISYA